jgi:hypothetical protein
MLTASGMKILSESLGSTVTAESSTQTGKINAGEDYASARKRTPGARIEHERKSERELPLGLKSPWLFSPGGMQPTVSGSPNAPRAMDAGGSGRKKQ